MKKRVLVFPCGSTPALDINTALKHSNLFEVFGASSIEDHGNMVFKNYIGGLPYISDNNFIEKFNEILHQYKLEFVIPTHDTVAVFLQEHKSEIPATIVCSNYATTVLCRYKSKAYAKLKAFSFVPKLFEFSRPAEIEYPVFVKKDDDQGAHNAYKVDNYEQLNFYFKNNSNMLICEFLPGEEMTVDCFTDRKGKLIFCNPRLSLRKYAGISARCTAVPLSEEVRNIAIKINDTIKFRGFWFFQIKKNNQGKFKLLEISTRFSGAFGLSRSLDVNLPVMALCDFCNMDISVSKNTYNIIADKALMGRYKINIDYERVYLDLDDTLVFNRCKVNSMMMMYVYQLLNQQKEIILISKHDFNIDETIKKVKIDKNIFSKIIKVPLDEPKYRYMDTDKPSIFIDNCFSERKAVRESLGIPCFDVSNIDCLLDWKE